MWGDPQTQATGQLLNSQFYHNYVGINAQQASGITIDGNQIRDNMGDGILIEAGSSDNAVTNNQIYGNNGLGIHADGADALANSWSQNLIYNNQLGGIGLLNGANNGIQPPGILHIWGSGLSGTAVPDATIEIFSDAGGQGRYFEGSTLADSDGQFSLIIPTYWQAEGVTAVVTDNAGNSSAFAPSQTVTICKIFVPLISQD